MWAKVDDKLHAHPKFAALPMSARGLWVTAMSWCADYLTDGELPERMVLAFGARRRDADRLVEAGLWEVTSTGFRFHDWGAYQPSARDAAKVRAEISEKRARSGAKGGRSKAANRAKSSSKPSSKCVANVKQMCSPEPEPGELLRNSPPNSPPDDDQSALIPVAAGGKPPERSTKPTRFDEFWQAYPRHTNRHQAEVKYEAQVKSGATEQQLIEAAVSFKQACLHNRTEQRFIPHPSTWLNQQRWRETPELIDGPRSRRQQETDAWRQRTHERIQASGGRNRLAELMNGEST